MGLVVLNCKEAVIQVAVFVTIVDQTVYFSSGELVAVPGKLKENAGKDFIRNLAGFTPVVILVV